MSATGCPLRRRITGWRAITPVPTSVAAPAKISAARASPVTTTKAATSIGPSTKTSSKSEVSAASAAGRSACRPEPTSVMSVQARRMAAVTGG